MQYLFGLTMRNQTKRGFKHQLPKNYAILLMQCKKAALQPTLNIGVELDKQDNAIIIL